MHITWVVWLHRIQSNSAIFPKQSYKPGRNTRWNVNNKGFLVWEKEGLEKGWNTQEKIWINILERAVTIKHTHRESVVGVNMSQSWMHSMSNMK